MVANNRRHFGLRRATDVNRHGADEHIPHGLGVVQVRLKSRHACSFVFDDDSLVAGEIHVNVELPLVSICRGERHFVVTVAMRAISIKNPPLCAALPGHDSKRKARKPEDLQCKALPSSSKKVICSSRSLLFCSSESRFLHGGQRDSARMDGSMVAVAGKFIQWQERARCFLGDDAFY